VGGGDVKRWHLASHLAGRHRLGLAFLHPPGGEAAARELVDRLRPEEWAAAPLARPRTPLSLLAARWRGLPLAAWRSFSPALIRRVADLARGRDAVLLDSVLVYPWLPPDFPGRVVLHAHNAEAVLLREYARHQPNPLVRAVARLEADRVRRLEVEACRRAQVVLAAVGDQIHLAGPGAPPGKFLETRHLGDDSLLRRPDPRFEDTGETLLFAGTLTWEPNVDGLLWFIRRVWDRLAPGRPSLRFLVVGGSPDPRLVEACRGRKGITLAGFVPDLEELYQTSRVFVAPQRYGSGMKVKVVNALSRGIPVVTTPVGAESLPVVGGTHLAVAAGGEEMAAWCLRLLDDRGLWERFRDSSRSLARREFTWDSVHRTLEEALHA
jgi:glycosyltransferase involved in cell wall biosynthesis